MGKHKEASVEFQQVAEPIAAKLRLDANETMVLARALEQSAVRAIEHVYPGLKVRQLAPMLEGVDPGADTYTWHEIQKTGKAEVITSYSDDLPSVGRFLTENVGRIRSIGTAYEYSTQDLRRAAMVASNGRQPLLDPRPAQIADEFIERKVDEIGALGDASHNLPGMLKHPSVTILPATGTWSAGGASAADIVKDLRSAIDSVAVDSDGNHSVTTVVMPIAQLRYLTTTPLLGTGDNRLTILQELVAAERAAGNELRFVDWAKCVGAGAGGLDRCMVYQQTSDVLGLVNPMRATFHPPQARGLKWVIPVEARVGGVDIFKPLACRYLDGI